MEDILNSGGRFIPENEIQSLGLTKEEKEELEREKEEIRQLNILSRSPAWQKAKTQLLEGVEKMKYEIGESCDNNASLESIGQNFKIYRIAEQKIKQLVEEVEVEEVENEDE